MAELVAALVVGNGDAEALRASLGAVPSPPTRTWCAVATAEEAAVARGLAQVHELASWPGSRAALARLHGAASVALADDDPVVIVTAGTLLQRGFATSAVGMLRAGAAVVLATEPGGGPTDGWGVLGRMTTAALAHAVLPPSSGLAMRSDTLHRLVEAGWLEGTELKLADIRELAGRTRVLRGGAARFNSSTHDGIDRGRRPSVTVLIPAHNEEAWIGETLRSVRLQTVPPDEVMVVDDCSTDRTGEVARHLGATVLRTPENRLKAGAQNYGLQHIRTDVVVTLDADTVLHPEAIDHLLSDIETGCDATNGAVLPQSRRGLWTRARLVEYAAAMRLYKRAQRRLGTILVLSGCVAAFRAEVLRAAGGFRERTLTEDLDLTWTLHLAGYRVGYAPRAVCYPAEPATWRLYKAQVRRWAAGFYQSIGVHGWSLRRNPGLVFVVATALWDILASAVVLAAAVFLIVTQGFTLTSGLVWAFLVIAVLVPFVLSASVVGVGTAATSLPAYMVGSWAGQYFYLEAMVREWVLRRRGRVWIKGH